MDDINNNKDKYSNEVFSKNLCYYLKKSGMTQTKLAKQIGVAQGTVSDWKICRSYPRIDKIKAMAAVFGIEKADLIEEKDGNNKYLLDRELSKTAMDLRKHPESMQLYTKIKKLSPHNRELITELIDALI